MPEQRPRRCPCAREHFGFADGFGQPALTGRRAGLPAPGGRACPAPSARWRLLRPGEFVLGYHDEDDVIARRAARAPLHRNGTFMVCRKLEQDVARSGMLATRARAVRRRQGARRGQARRPLARRHAADALARPARRTLAGDKWRTTTSATPTTGRLQLPGRAHIRRANPRERCGGGGAHPPAPDHPARDAVRAPLPEGTEGDDEERGLLFVVLQREHRPPVRGREGWLAGATCSGSAHDDPLGERRRPGVTIEGDPPVSSSRPHARSSRRAAASTCSCRACERSAARRRRGGRYRWREGRLTVPACGAGPCGSRDPGGPADAPSPSGRAWSRLAGLLPDGLGGRWVTGHDDVVDVLSRDREFGMTYLRRMEQLRTPFILGMNPSAFVHRSRALRPRSPASTSRAREARSATTPRGAGRAPAKIDARHADRSGAGPHRRAELWSGGALTQDQIAHARAISRDIFINPSGTRRSATCGDAPRRVCAGHRAVVAARKDARRIGRHDDVLDRLLNGRRLDGDELIDDLLGVTVAWVTSVSRTMAYAFDELLSRERSQELARAQSAAHYGDAETVGEIVFEALRFRPSMPALERVCTREARLGGRTIRRDRS